MRIASIDLGSNSFLLCIGEKQGGQLKILFDECRVVGLAKRLTAEGKVSSDALERAHKVMTEFNSIIKTNQVDKIIAVATESLRRPANGEEVRALLESWLGYPIDIISAQREAELSFWSVRKDPKCPTDPVMVFDIGGASTELIEGADKMNSLTSLRLGSVVLTEKFQLDEPRDYRPALDYCKALIRASEVSQAKSKIGIGVAGTMTTLLALQLQLKSYDRKAVHATTISKEDLQIWVEKIFQMKLDERKNIVGLPSERADVFGGGALIALSLMEYFDWDKIYCFDTGVRYGLLYEAFEL